MTDHEGETGTERVDHCDCGSRPYEIGGAEHRWGCPAQIEQRGEGGETR